MCWPCAMQQVWLAQVQIASGEVNQIQIGQGRYKLLHVLHCQMCTLRYTVSYAVMWFAPQISVSPSLMFPCSKTVVTVVSAFSTHAISPPAIMSCPLAHNCFLTALHMRYIICWNITYSFQDLLHSQTVFSLDSGRVKLVVEEVKNQLFEGTSKWPMAADSCGLEDPHYVL